jgi:hypothetical protein
VTFAAVAGHRCGRATPSLRDAPQRQSMERIGRDSIYRDRNAVQTMPATSKCRRFYSEGIDFNDFLAFTLVTRVRIPYGTCPVINDLGIDR